MTPRTAVLNRTFADEASHKLLLLDRKADTALKIPLVKHRHRIRLLEDR